MRGSELLGSVRPVVLPSSASVADDLRDALLAARLVALLQSVDQLAAASERYGWRLDLEAVAGLSRGVCIIRAKVLDHVIEALRHPAPIILDGWFTGTLRATQPGWRRVVAQAVAAGVPTPVLSAALSYQECLRRERSPANLIQALRDDFGAHGYTRLDREGDRHTDWSATAAS